MDKSPQKYVAPELKCMPAKIMTIMEKKKTPSQKKEKKKKKILHIRQSKGLRIKSKHMKNSKECSEYKHLADIMKQSKRRSCKIMIIIVENL